MWVWSSWNTPSTVQSSPDGLLHEEGEEPEGEELMAKKEQFKNKLKTYCDSKGKRGMATVRMWGERRVHKCVKWDMSLRTN